MTRKTPTTIDTETAAAFDASRELNLTAIAANINELCDNAISQRSSYPAFLTNTLQAELDVRHERKRARRVHEARLPRLKTLDTFNLEANPNISAHTISILQNGVLNRPVFCITSRVGLGAVLLILGVHSRLLRVRWVGCHRFRSGVVCC
jgi:DNA replication protein DnaC